MDYKLELVVLPVADVDRAKEFYERAGFRLETDHSSGPGFRVVQLTPEGSACSIAIGVGIGQAEPGSARGLHLVVEDIDAAHDDLAGRGIPVGEPFHFGAEGQAPGSDPEHRPYASFMTFADPDGNAWLVQEVRRS